MGYIKHKISKQGFELIRDRIGEIITDEFSNQFIWSYDPLFDLVKVWRERFINFDKTECPAVNICVASGDYSNKHQGSVDGDYSFNIDVYTNSKTVGADSGDTLSVVKNHQLIGAIRAILEDNTYRTLLFPSAFISRTAIEGFKVGDVQKGDDGLRTCMSRIIFKVVCNEITLPIPDETVAGYVTSVKLHETDKGFYWGGE